MRRIYQLILRAHPRVFRERFGAEMLWVFDEAAETEGAFPLLVDGIKSLLRQRVFRLHARRNRAQRHAEPQNIFGSLLVAQQATPLKMSRLLLGGAISFNLFVIACALIGGGRVHSAQREQIYANETEPAQALNPSDLMSISDECAPGVSLGCPARTRERAVLSDVPLAGLPSKPDELPFPSGRFGIGRVSYPFSPSNPLSASAGDSEMKLLIWYPATIDPGSSVPVDNVWGYSKSIGKWVQTHTVENAAIAADSGRFPLILFSAAEGNQSAAYLSQIENLVSHGYIVASLEKSEAVNGISFQDTRLTIFESDMRRAFFFPEMKGAGGILTRAEGFEESRESTEAAKLSSAFNQVILLATNRSQTAPFNGRVDLEHVGAFGHGSGGNAIAQLCASDLRISACLDEDGWTPSGLLSDLQPRQPPHQPFFWIDVPLKWPDGAELAYAHIAADEFGRLATASGSAADRQLESMTNGAYRVSLFAPDLTDKNFTDGPLVWSMTRGHINDIQARAALVVINIYSRTFFDKYLKNKSAPLLDSNSKSSFSHVRFQHYGVR